VAKYKENVATSGPGTGASERSAYIVGDSAAEASPETQERAAAMLDLQQHRPSQGSLPTEVCQEEEAPQRRQPEANIEAALERKASGV
jgi:hypothetical protein